MVLHVFTANRYHLVPAISKGFVTVFKDDAEQVLLLYGNKALNKQKYIDLYEHEGFHDYVFCFFFIEYLSIIRKYKNSSILFHAGSYHWFLLAWLLGCRKINWVCWGAGASAGKGLRSWLSIPYKRFMYHRFSSIVTLMDADSKTICHDFCISPSKIETISYMSMGDGVNEYDYLKQELMMRTPNNPKPVVLVGNNPSCISGYLELLPRMKLFAGKIIVKCMLNYSLHKDEKYEALLKMGRSYFGDDFVLSEEFYNDKGYYIRYMNECDIYICPVRRQSGLGAVNTCLGLGKKIYITGKNLTWIRDAYGATVFDANVIDERMSFTDFSTPLSDKEKKSNFDSVINRRASHVNKWRQYLSALDKA